MEEFFSGETIRRVYNDAYVNESKQISTSSSREPFYLFAHTLGSPGTRGKNEKRQFTTDDYYASYANQN